jgi:translocation and assembly module TamA
VRSTTIARLHALGYPNPVVDVQLLPGPPGDDAVLRIASAGGARIEPERLVVHGLPRYDAELLASRFSARQDLVELWAGDEAQRAFLEDLLDAAGFPTPRLIGEPRYDADDRSIVIELEPGPRRQVAEVVVTGVPEDAAARLVLVTNLEPGQPLRLADVSAARAALERDLADRGHLDVEVRSVTRAADLARPLESVVQFEVVPGPVHVLDDVRFEGLHAAKPRWTRKVAALERGERLERSDVAEARRQLARSGVFSRVTSHTLVRGPAISIPAEGDEERVEADVSFELVEAPRFGLSYGGRWESDSGFAAVVDLVDRNSLGRGHTAGVRAVAGTSLVGLRLYYAIPRIINPRSSLELFLEGREEELSSEETEQLVEAWVQLTTALGPRTSTRFYTRLQDRQVELDDPLEPTDERNVSPRFGWQWALSTLDRSLGASDQRGLFFGVDLSFASERLGSDLTLVALFNQLRYFRKLPLGLGWAQSWRTGLVDARNDTIPTGERLFVGGEFSVRGYPDRSLGPLDDEGVALGGEVEFIVNQELHRPILRGLDGLVFFDAGNVWPSLQELDSELFESAGCGLRYASPIGPLRLDVAFPLDRREGDDEVRYYFGFGNVF